MGKTRGFGFGIIGCGMIGNFHAKAIADIRTARLVACFDAVPAAADRLARAQGCRAYHSLKQMLADSDLDVVTVGTPSGAHLEPAVVATLRFANGALGVIEATTAAYPGYLKRIEIHGSEGSAAMEEEDVVAWDFARKLPADAAVHRRMAESISTAGGASDPAAIGHHGHTEQFRDVLEAIRQNRKPAIDGREGRRSVEIILGIYKAAETGKTVKLPLASDPVLKARQKKTA